MSKTKLKKKQSLADKYRQHWAYSLGVEASKRTITNHLVKNHWRKGFLLGTLLGLVLMYTLTRILQP